MRRRDTLPGRWLRTAAHLRPEQVTARLGLRARRAASGRLPGLAAWTYGAARPYRGQAGTFGGWPATFVPFDGRTAASYGDPDVDDPDFDDPDQLAKGYLTLLGTTRRLRDPSDPSDPSGSGS
nr:hypothetical protein [Micromonospora sp. DSM 115978]